MMRALKRLAALVLPRVKAGACAGNIYVWLDCGRCGCTSGGRHIRKECEYMVVCGYPYPTGAFRCVTTPLVCAG